MAVCHPRTSGPVAGVCPGNNGSAGKRCSGRTRPGDPWPVEALVQAAWAATRAKDSYLAAQV